jgi:hypothetical protein
MKEFIMKVTYFPLVMLLVLTVVSCNLLNSKKDKKSPFVEPIAPAQEVLRLSNLGSETCLSCYTQPPDCVEKCVYVPCPEPGGYMHFVKNGKLTFLGTLIGGASVNGTTDGIEPEQGETFVRIVGDFYIIIPCGYIPDVTLSATGKPPYGGTTVNDVNLELRVFKNGSEITDPNKIHKAIRLVSAETGGYVTLGTPALIDSTNYSFICDGNTSVCAAIVNVAVSFEMLEIAVHPSELDRYHIVLEVIDHGPEFHRESSSQTSHNNQQQDPALLTCYSRNTNNLERYLCLEQVPAHARDHISIIRLPKRKGQTIKPGWQEPQIDFYTPVDQN